jgi:hypothetical protein
MGLGNLTYNNLNRLKKKKSPIQLEIVLPNLWTTGNEASEMNPMTPKSHTYRPQQTNNQATPTHIAKCHPKKIQKKEKKKEHRGYYNFLRKCLKHHHCQHHNHNLRRQRKLTKP